MPFLTGSYKWKIGLVMCLALHRAAQTEDMKLGVRASVCRHLLEPGRDAWSQLLELTCRLFSSADKLSLL